MLSTIHSDLYLAVHRVEHAERVRRADHERAARRANPRRRWRTRVRALWLRPRGPDGHSVAEGPPVYV